MKYKILISIKAQSLELLDDEQIKHTYRISSAKAGIGQLKGSYQTPLGHHVIRAKIGGDSPIFSVFKGRRATGKIWDLQMDKDYPNDDWILSRILWLSGKDIGHNRLGKVDSMQRFIYIHGTNEESLIGEPASHGCIRMANKDVISLFNLVDIGTEVFINEE